jgi:hypothetical protein
MGRTLSEDGIGFVKHINPEEMLEKEAKISAYDKYTR